MSQLSQSSTSTDYDALFGLDDSQTREVLLTLALPTEPQTRTSKTSDDAALHGQDQEELNSYSVTSSKRRHDEVDDAAKFSYNRLQDPKRNHEIYGEAHFGDFGEYMRRKRAKLQIQNVEIDPTKPEGIFEGIAIYINGYTRPSVQELRELIVKHGGVFQAYLDKKSIVTHIITCSLTPAKVREFKHMKVVTPEWLTQSVEQGVLLPWEDFIFQHGERSETFQGIKPRRTQPTLLQSSSSNAASSSNPLYVTDPKNKKEASLVPHYAADKSNPNAQRVMANPEWRNAHTSVAPDFIEGFYKNSRLHHLSTWKAELKHLVQEAQERAEEGIEGKIAAEENPAIVGGGVKGVSMRGAEFVMRSPSKKDKGKAKEVPIERVIMHCDFDCFFVSAGLTKRPELRGKPVVVCHSQGAQGGASSTSEIASASYECRKFGIKNGMSLQQARKLCPEVMTIPYEFELYKRYSLQFYTILMGHADDLQAVSVDEALIDVSNTVDRLKRKSKSADPAKDLAEAVREEVRKATECEVSIGVSHNIMLARLSTRRAKPAGSYHLLPEDVQEYMSTLDISDLHGFGWSTKQKALDKLSSSQLGDLANKSKAVLCDALGKSTGETLYNAIRGIDDKRLESDKPRKSVSCEINYGIRFENHEQAETFIYQLSAEVSKRLIEVEMIGRSMTLKIMKRDPTAPIEAPKFMGHGACDVFNKQLAIQNGRATADDKVIGEQAWRMLKSFNFDPKELRGIGIQIQKLEPVAGSDKGALPKGQGTIGFQVAAKPPSRVQFADPGPSPPTKDAFKQDKPGPPPDDLPSFSQIDMEVFNALPADLRGELENAYQEKRKSASPFPEPKAGPSNLPARSILPGARPPSAKPLFSKRQLPLNASRITQQLAPRTVFAPRRKLNSLIKYKGVKSMHMTDEDLRKVGIDPDVLAALPKNIRDEQLVRARLLKRHGKLPKVSSQRKVLKPRKLSPKNVRRLPNPKARYLQAAVLRRRGQKNGEKLYFTEADDVQNVIEAWVARHKKFPPNPKDVEFFAKYLIQCVDGDTCSDMSVQKAVAVMKWWMVLLRRHWKDFENMAYPNQTEGHPEKEIGEVWWQYFWSVKERMDEVARKRFGGKLSLR